MTDERRRIPGVDRVLAQPALTELLERFPRELVVDSLRMVLDDVRRTFAHEDGAASVPADGKALEPGALALKVEALVAHGRLPPWSRW